EEDELARLADGLGQGLQRFATGVYLAWYPIKDPKPVARFHGALAALGTPRLLCVELLVRHPVVTERLNGCGLIVANPPHTLRHERASLLPDLPRRLADGTGAGYRLAPISATGDRRSGHRSPRTQGAKRSAG